MLVLGLNTVGSACDVALVADGRVVASLTEPMQQGHDARLAPLVDQLMREAGVGFDKLSRIAVIVGPGSFVGVRVGVAFARGLALALEAPAMGVSSLEALGAGAGRVLGVLGAKRRPPEVTWWVQMLENGVGVGAPGEADLDGVTAMARSASAVMGDVAGIDAPALVPVIPSAVNAARFALRFAPGATLPPPTPIYVRAPDAKPQTPVPMAPA